VRLAFDLETNGLLDTVSVVHCIAVVNIDTGQEHFFLRSAYRVQGLKVDGDILDGIAYLKKATTLVAHNLLGFDYPVLQKLYGFLTNAELIDTFVMAPLAYPDVRDEDFKRSGFPMKLIGKHSLESWGFRLNMRKGDYGKERTDWSTFDVDMVNYCLQDARICASLYKECLKKTPCEAAVKLEHDFANVIRKMERTGVAFDSAKAHELIGTLRGEQDAISKELQNVFPPKEIEYETPVRKEKRHRTVPFNPNSRQQIANNLKDRYGWAPTKLTDTGLAVVDEEVLDGLEYPEAKLLSRHMMLAKRIGQLSDGDNGLLKLVKEGRIHGRVATLGTVTGRCSHHSPNLAQVPSVEVEYGKDFRSLFTAGDGRVLVGCDAKGIQLRCLAHYLAPYDNGEYARLVVEGDPHERNRVAAGLTTRAEAKRFIYAFLFGAGNNKLGNILNCSPAEAANVRKRFLENLPAFGLLTSNIENVLTTRKYLKGLDGRLYHIRSAHSALNLLLQGAEAILMKKATVLLELALRENTKYVDTKIVLHVHDEIQVETSDQTAADVGALFRVALQAAGTFYKFRCPLDTDAKVGANWAETH
jgi:DNA polymerase I-like protein with 3'-5' exonuclease and polymerase domains